MKINGIITINDTLKKDFWKGKQLNSRVKSKLLAIADNFFEDLQLENAVLQDITLTGSIANFNWTENSDIDLHLLVDFSKIDENYDLVREFFNAKTSNWNKNHDITIFGHQVEIYVQDISDEHYSSGVYSIKNGNWDPMPSRKEPKIDKLMVKRKINSFIDMIDRAEDLFDDKDYKDANKFALKLAKKIKRFRQSGLEDRGEYSYENLTFKYLRSNDFIKLLYDIRDKSYDKMMSIEGKYDKKFKIFVSQDEKLDSGEFRRLDELEKYQKKVARRHKRHKLALLGSGSQPTGRVYPKRPNYRRGKSSPPGAGGT
jgi:hypothetical protein